MKITSELGNTKADKATKLANLMNANHRTVRHDGKMYFITVAKVGNLILADACADLSPLSDEPTINLFGTDTLAKELKKLCENRLYT
jgi:hypothetical protein